MAQRSKATRRKATKPQSDAALIQECVTYAQSVTAWRGGFRADPDGDSCYAAPAGAKYEDRARQALTTIAATPAKTPDGLCAKARIVSVVFEYNEGCAINEGDRRFLISFGADVKAFLQPICDAREPVGAPAGEVAR